MTPSLRSHPNHPQQPISLPYTRFVRGNGYGSGHWLRHLPAGSPLLKTESGSLSFGTTDPPRAAPHPVSRRRSCLRLLSRCSSRDDSDFHWLISYMCVRTSTARLACVRWRAPWLQWEGCEQVDQFPHGRDGRPPFFSAAKSNFKGPLVLFDHAKRPQQDLNFFPLPQGQGSLRPALGNSRLSGSSKRGAGWDCSG